MMLICSHICMTAIISMQLYIPTMHIVTSYCRLLMCFLLISYSKLLKEQKELYTPAGKLKDTFLGGGGGGGWGGRLINQYCRVATCKG